MRDSGKEWGERDRRKEEGRQKERGK